MGAIPGYNLAEIHEAISSQIPERDCIVFRDRRLTYSQVTDRSRRLANALRARGLDVKQPTREGLSGHESHTSHVAIYAHNGNEYLETMLGAFKARLAPVNVNYRYVAEELQHVLRDSAAAAIVFHSAFAPTLAEVLPNLQDLRVMLQISDDSGHDLLPGAEWYEDVIAAASPDLPECASDWSPDDLYILYTGGTTGLPKGVLWRQADIHRTSMGGRDATRQPWRTLGDLAATAAGPRRNVVCPAAPFMHGAGHWVAFMAMNQGSTVVIQDDVTRLDPKDLCALLEREGVTFLQIVGDAFGRPIVEELETGTYDASSLTTLLSGGAALSAGIKDRFLAAQPGIVIIDGLGSSEGGGQGMQVTTGNAAASTGSFIPSEGSVVVSEDLTRVLSPGDSEVGWMAKKGDIPLGYLGDEEKTARTFPVVAGEQMSVPGDRARWRDDGSIDLLGRDSVTINSGGEKIFAEEVEAAIVASDDVADALVTGRPSERWGQEVVAVVQLRQGSSASAEDLARAAAVHIARYKLPKAWVFVDEVKRSAAGKADYRWAMTLAADAPSSL